MKTFAILTIALSAAVIGAAHAASPNPPTAVVRYDDLDVGSTRGSNALLQRLQGAARVVCSDFDPIRSAREALSLHVTLRESHEKCMQQAIDAAVAKINDPQFTAYVASVQTPPAQYSQLAKR